MALLDLNLETGDVGTFLNVNPTYILSSLTANVERLDENFLVSVMFHHPSGPFVLTDAPEFDENLPITPERVHRVINIMKGTFDYVIVDCVGPFAGCNVPILRNSSIILLPATFDKPSIENMRRNLSQLERRGIRPDAVKFVLNRYIPIPVPAVKDAIDAVVSAAFQVISDEYNDVIDSINKGIPIVKMFPRSRVSIAIRELACNVELTLKSKV